MSRRLRQIGLTAVVAAILATSCVIAYPALQGWPSEAAPPAMLPSLKTERERQAKMLAGYRWIDREKQIVGLPIDRAMELVVTESQARAATRPASSSTAP